MRNAWGFFLFLAACGGQVISVGEGGTVADRAGGGMPSTDGGGTGNGAFPICPPDPPPARSACSAVPPNNGCRYYLGGVNGTCEAFVCTSGMWLADPSAC